MALTKPRSADPRKAQPGQTAGMSPTRMLAACGIVGPVLFTATWAVSSLLQNGHSATQVQLSGLAAMDAQVPQLMMAGFLGLGVCSIALGAGLAHRADIHRADTHRADTHRADIGRAGPWLVRCAGAATVAAGLFRRDHMLLVGPGFLGESWHNQVHDLVSGVGYAAMIAAPLVLARRFGSCQDWASLARPLRGLSLSSAAALALFASGIAGPWDPVVQRVAVSAALTAEVLIALRLLSLAGDQAEPR